MASPRYMRSRSFKFLRKTAGNYGVSSTAWSNLDITLDLTLEAQAGDVVEFSMSGLTGQEAPVLTFDVVTVVAGAAVNSFSGNGAETTGSTGDGNMAWFCFPSNNHSIGGSIMYALVAGDIAAGSVTLRLRTKVQAAGTRTLFAAVGDPLQIWARNLGPQQPN